MSTETKRSRPEEPEVDEEAAKKQKTPAAAEDAADVPAELPETGATPGDNNEADGEEEEENGNDDDNEDDDDDDEDDDGEGDSFDSDFDPADDGDEEEQSPEETALIMLAAGENVDLIADYTGLSVEQINALKAP